VAERCGHHSRLGDDNVEGLTFGLQVVSASAYALQAGKIEFNQFEASAMGRGVFARLLGCSFGLVQIPCGTHNGSAVSGKRTRRLTPSPAETPVIKMRLPVKFTPDKTSSEVEVAPDQVVEVAADIFGMLFSL
jgi:hypothetical protein